MYPLLRDTTMYHISGTKFFRLGSRKVLGYGGNHQNKSDNLRSIYVTDGWHSELRPKYVQYLKSGNISIFTEEEQTYVRPMLQCDQAGAEALIVSKLLKPGNKLDLLFKNKIKPHTYLGCFFPQTWIDEGYTQVDVIRMLPIPKVKEHEGWSALAKAIADSDGAQAPKVRHYYLYKQTCHSGNYGIKAPTFILNILEKSGGKVVLSNRQGEEFLGAYHTMVPELRDWWAEMEVEVRKEGMVHNLFGDPITFTQELKDSDLKDVYAACPQSTVGCITNNAYVKFQTYIEENKKLWDLLVNCHDSILIQCPILEVKEAARILRDCIEQTLVSPIGETFKMRSETQVGFNWSKGKKIKFKVDESDPKQIEQFNLDGLKEVDWLWT